MTTSNPALTLTPQRVHGRMDARLLWRAYRYLRPKWKMVVGAYLMGILTIGLNLIVPQILRWAIDNGIRVENLPLLGWASAALMGLTLLKGVLVFVQGRWSEVISQYVAYDLRNAIQRHLTQLSFAYHNQAETGELLSRAIQDVERIRFFTGRATLRLAEGVLLMVGTGAVLVWMNPGLALLVLATLPLLIWRALTFGRRFRPLSQRIQQQLAVLTTRVEQNLRGSRVVKAFAQEPAEIARFDAENELWFQLSAEAGRLQAVAMPFLFLVANAGTVFIIWYGGNLVMRGALTLGELVAFTTYLAQLVNPVRQLGMIIPAIAMAGSAAERIFEILDTVPDVRDEPGARPLPPLRGHVRFENVSFAYERQGVLKDISFEALPGQVVALLGATGSGKSTIVNLIPRFYDPTHGRVLVDGYDVRHVTLNSLRSQIGIVLQETTLFATTIRENITFGRPDATQAEVEAAARDAQAHEFISRLPDGYDTRVGERGVTLSGGQKQRLAIARAILLNPRILILDDATSSVDTETERLIQQALDRLMRPGDGQGRTTFVIAHRLSTVRRADLILVLERGRIAARGTHESLLRTSRLYAEVYQHQLRPDAAVAANGGRPA